MEIRTVSVVQCRSSAVCGKHNVLECKDFTHGFFLEVKQSY